MTALHAIAHLLAGRDYEPSTFDIDEAVGHVMAASARIGQEDQALRVLERLAANVPADAQMMARLGSRIAEIRKGPR